MDWNSYKLSFNDTEAVKQAFKKLIGLICLIDSKDGKLQMAQTYYNNYSQGFY